MKVRLLILTLLFSVLGWGQSLLISQYIETNSGTTPKGIEVFNHTTTPIVLSAVNNLQVMQGTNGAALAQVVNITSGTIPAYGVWVVGTSDLTTFVGGSNITTFAFTFNGDDALQIRLGGVTQDTFGNPGSDPGASWSGSGVSTADQNIQILNAICVGNTAGFTDPSTRYSNIATGSVMTGFGVAPTGCPISSNTITTNTALTGSPFCVSASTSASVTVPFTSVGAFNAGNVYTAQLSNAAGSFAAPVNIGTVTSTLNADVILATIPAGTAAGTGYRIRVVSNNPAVTGSDNTVNLTVQNSAAITTQPSTTVQNLCQGTAATALSVVATGTTLSYQWYSNTLNSNLGGTAVGTNSASYTPVTTTVGTLYYYCVVTAACGAPVTSNVSGAVNVSAVPANPAGAITVSANPSCGPATLSYPAGSYWQTTAGGTSTASPTSGTYPVSVTGTTVYVRNFNGTCWSTGAINSGAITVNTPVAITTQPVASVIFSGSNTTFSVGATGTGLSYQWQVDTGSGFTNLTNVAPYSNVTTTTMNITAATVGMNGYLYRCVVSGAAPCASVNSNSALLTVTLYVPAGTVLKPGDLVFVGYDSTSTATCAGAEDKFYVASLVDILPGTQFLVVNSRYESGAAANVRTDKWYSGGSAPFDDPGIITFTWGGATSIPKGSIISFRADALVISEIKIDNVLAPSLTFTTNLNQCNISSSDPDQIYLMQGLFTPFGTVGTTRYNTFIGRVLYGLTNGVSWVPFSSAVSAGTTGGATRESRLPDDIECFNIESTSLNGVRFYNNSSLHTGTKYQLLSALINVGNWTIPANTNCLNVVEDFTGVTGVAVGKPFVITLGNPDGTWTGATDTDWFKCANWEGLAVPKATDDVIIPASPVNQPIIGASPLKYPIGAFSNNLTLDNGSTLGMPSTLSQLNLYANWTNNSGSTNFSEGSGTVYFEGSAPQVINAVTPEGTETFHNVVLNNNFTTSVSNDIIANGDLTVGIGKTLEVSPLDYVQVTDNVTNNGTFNIKNTGSLVQINDLGVNTGNISYERIASVKLQDYVYWSSPVTGFDVNSISPLTPAYYHWLWNPTVANTNGGLGNWQNASTVMTAGQGYIVRAPNGFSNAANQNWTATFNNGVPRNGVYTPTIARGNFTGVDYLGTNGVTITANDDNWNLLGNPYPSAISIGSFLTANPQLDGFVRLWTHGTLPVSSVNPFYDSFVYNYTAGDYVAINGAGATSGPGVLSVIGGGQGFFTLMLPGAATASTATFNNAMRNRTFANSQFYRSANTQNEVGGNIARNRIWIDLVSPTMESTRTLVAYVEGATLGKDRMFDALTDYKSSQNFYSLLGNDAMTIQGRSLPFDVNDQVPMGIKTPTNGTYTIAIAAVDGLFAGKAQKIYIEDKLLGTINDITAVPYQFTATQGITNNRFVLRYTNQALSAEDYDLVNNAVTVFASTKGININSTTESIKGYTVYNVLGQTLAEKNNVNANESVVNTIAKNNQALIVKIVLANNQAIIKKIIF